MANQTDLTEYLDEPNTLFGDAQDFVGEFYGSVRNRLEDVGIDLDWLSQSPDALEGYDDADLWTVQYVQAFSKGRLADRYNWDIEAPQLDGSASPEVQFKTGIYVVGEPDSDELVRRFRAVDNPRLVTAFDTDRYTGYMSGFGFQERKTYQQVESVSKREVTDKDYGLGVPWFEVEAYDDNGELAGYADGYFNPYTRDVTEEVTVRGADPPQQEVWTFGSRHKHGNGERYRIAPPPDTPARERAKAANDANKDAYINGFPVGGVLQRGRIQLKVEYGDPSRASNYSRRQIIEQSGTPYQALREGANLYKVRETGDKIMFSTTKPDNWEAADPERMSPDAVGREQTVEEVTNLLLDDEASTQFYVEEDVEVTRLMGLYNPPRARDIVRETTLVPGG